MSSRPTGSDRDRSLLYVRAHARLLAEEMRRIDHALESAQAGFPSGHDGGGGQAEVCWVCAGNGSVKIPGLDLLEVCGECDGQGYIAESWDDRTQSSAMSPDDARRDKDRLANHIQDARSHIEAAWDLAEKWLRVSDAKPETEGEPCCTSCARLPDEVQGIFRSSRCRWCYDYYNDEVVLDGEIIKPRYQDVPKEILIIRRVLMRSVTTKDWREWQRTHGRHRKKAS